MSNNKNKSPKNSFNPIKVAWVCFGAAILFVLLHFVLSPEINVEKEMTWKNYSEYFFSLGSIFLTASSIIFFTHTLSQQTKALQQQDESLELQRTELKNQIEEMKTSNETSKAQLKSIALQQAESTFFNLLSNHKELVNTIKTVSFGYKGLNETTKQIKEELEIYSKAIVSKNFENDEFTSYYSISSFIRYPELTTLTASVTLIIEFIATKLNDDYFYHSILNNNLNTDEKFILGMAIENDLITLETKTFEYSRLFLSKTPYHSAKIDGDFPHIKIVYPKNHMGVARSIKGFANDTFRVSLNILNSNENYLKLREVEVFFIESDSPDKIIWSAKREITTTSFDFIEHFKGYFSMFDKMEKSKGRVDSRVLVTYHFTYQGKAFTVQSALTSTISYNGNDENWYFYLRG